MTASGLEEVQVMQVGRVLGVWEGARRTLVLSFCCEPAGGHMEKLFASGGDFELRPYASGFVGSDIAGSAAKLVGGTQGLSVESRGSSVGEVISQTGDRWGSRALIVGTGDVDGVLWLPSPDRVQYVELARPGLPPDRISDTERLGLVELSAAVDPRGFVNIAGCSNPIERPLIGERFKCQASELVVISVESGDIVSRYDIEPGSILAGFDERLGLLYVDPVAGVRVLSRAGVKKILLHGEFVAATWLRQDW